MSTNLNKILAQKTTSGFLQDVMEAEQTEQAEQPKITQITLEEMQEPDESQRLSAIAELAEKTTKTVYHVTVFAYGFHSPTNVREKIKPNKQGIYEPKDDAEIALLEFQVFKGLIGKTEPKA